MVDVESREQQVRRMPSVDLHAKRPDAGAGASMPPLAPDLARCCAQAVLFYPQDQSATNVPPYAVSTTGFLPSSPSSPVIVQLETQARAPARNPAHIPPVPQLRQQAQRTRNLAVHACPDGCCGAGSLQMPGGLGHMRACCSSGLSQ